MLFLRRGNTKAKLPVVASKDVEPGKTRMAGAVGFRPWSALVPQPLQFRLQPYCVPEMPKTDFGKLAAFLQAAKMFHYACHRYGS